MTSPVAAGPDTEFSRLFGAPVPIANASMGWVAHAELAAAVSGAGGFGVLAAGNRTPEWLDGEIARTRELTDRPFGVGILLPLERPGGGGVDVDVARIERALADLDPERRAAADEMGRWYLRDHLDSLVDVLCGRDVRAVVFALGTAAWAVDRLHAGGIPTVGAMAGTVRQGRLSRDAGCDFVIAIGTEAGGHTGAIGTMTLVPQMVDALGPLPVLAGGGIHHGSQLAAALAMGAAGVWVGTRFAATREAACHPRYKEELVARDAPDAVITRAYSGKTTRALRNEFTEHYARHPDQLRPFPEQMLHAAREFLTGHNAHGPGDMERGFLGAGQGVGGIHDLPGAGEVVERMRREADEATRRAVTALDASGAPRP